MTVTIREITLPVSHDDEDWVAYCGIQQQAVDEEEGEGLRRLTPEAMLQTARADQLYTTTRWLARIDGVPAGVAVFQVNRRDDPGTGYVTVFVAPEHRRQGVGGRLAEQVKELVGEGFTRLHSEVTTPVPEGERLTAPGGVGAVQADHPGVRMALAHGFRLSQVGRNGHYEFAAPAVPLERALEEATAAAQGYEVLCFEGVPAPELRDDIAVLKGRMSLDEPLGDTPRVEYRWDAARVLEHYTDQHRTKRVFIAVAVERASGRLVAINELLSSRAHPENPIYQWDTLVLPDHRGHRLGMLVKAANLRAVHEAVPESPLVTTFNAAENEPMLAVNDALGFVTHHVSGVFIRKLP